MREGEDEAEGVKRTRELLNKFVDARDSSWSPSVWLPSTAAESCHSFKFSISRSLTPARWNFSSTRDRIFNCYSRESMYKGIGAGSDWNFLIKRDDLNPIDWTYIFRRHFVWKFWQLRLRSLLATCRVIGSEIGNWLFNYLVLCRSLILPRLCGTQERRVTDLFRFLAAANSSLQRENTS